MYLQDTVHNYNKPYVGEAGRSFGARLQKRRHEVSQRNVRAGGGYTRNTRKSSATEQNKSAVTDHAISQPRHRLGPCQGDRQRKQQNGPTVDQRSDTHQKGTRQVDEPRRGVLPTSSYL